MTALRIRPAHCVAVAAWLVVAVPPGAAAGTSGRYYPACLSGGGMRFGQVGVLTQLEKNASFRSNVGAGNQDIAYATVEAQTPGGRVWAYAAVVDATTGDPTTMPVPVR